MNNHYCKIDNDFIRIIAPPRSPQLNLLASTSNSFTVNVKSNPNETASVDGYTLYYKRSFDEKWQDVNITANAQNYTVENVNCGSNFTVYTKGYNRYVILLIQILISIIKKFNLFSNFFNVVLDMERYRII